jgi:hypothetical protein
MSKFQRMVSLGMITRDALGFEAHERVRDDGNMGGGDVGGGHLDDVRFQSAGNKRRASGKPSASVYGREHAPGHDHINAAKHTKATYPGHRMTSKGQRRTGVKGGVVPSGPMYGSYNSRKQNPW